MEHGTNFKSAIPFPWASLPISQMIVFPKKINRQPCWEILSAQKPSLRICSFFNAVLYIIILCIVGNVFSVCSRPLFTSFCRSIKWQSKHTTQLMNATEKVQLMLTVYKGKSFFRIRPFDKKMCGFY